jgi:hypothetical protein
MSRTRSAAASVRACAETLRSEVAERGAKAHAARTHVCDDDARVERDRPGWQLVVPRRELGAPDCRVDVSDLVLETQLGQQ